MQRVICLGNNTEDTDIRSRRLAHERGLVYHGLLSELDQSINSDSYQAIGLYHSSVFDIAIGRLIDIINEFDLVIVLDQMKEEWSHVDAYLKTLRVAKTVKTPVEYLDPNAAKKFNYFEELVQVNPSFCIFPFIELLATSKYSKVCCRSSTPVSKITNIGDWRTNSAYQNIRQKMIAGERIWNHCKVCYQLEDQGIRSARQQETVEWANRLDLSSIDDLSKIAQPVYFEIRASNKCNLQCRMCNPESSHLIDQEYQRLGLRKTKSVRTYDYGFDLVDFANLEKLYVAGGEPLIMPEFYAFLDECISLGNVDFEFLINTNGTKISEKFKEQIKHFRDLQFIFSLDGYGDLNHYIRWPSDWSTIIENLAYLIDQGHKCAINTTVSIYNVSKLYDLFEFLDRRFPNLLIHIGFADMPTAVSPWSYPDRQAVIDSIDRVRTLPCYSNDALFASSIDGILSRFESIKDIPANLENFFLFNDKLDQSRSIRLMDYLPELEAYRTNTFD